MKNLCILFFAIIPNLSIAQTTVTINYDKIIDAELYMTNRSGYSHMANTNYGNSSRFMANAWTESGSTTFRRSLIKFDLSAIEPGTIIDNATLYLYSDPNVTSSSAWNGNSKLSGSNAVILEQVIDSWDESIVTWNNQPSTSQIAATWVPESSSTTENITVDLTFVVSNWIDYPENNNGLKMILENELKYRARTYTSSEHANSSIRPKLVIQLRDTSTYSCSTTDMDTTEFKNLPYYGNNQMLYDLLDSIDHPLVSGLNGSNARLISEDDYFRIPIQFYIYRDDNGNSDYNEAMLRTQLIRLNQLFRQNQVGMSFYQTCNPIYIDDSDKDGHIKRWSYK